MKNIKVQSNLGLLSKLCASEEVFCISKDKTCKYQFEGGLLFMITESGTTLKTFFGINDIGTFDISVVHNEK